MMYKYWEFILDERPDDLDLMNDRQRLANSCFTRLRFHLSVIFRFQSIQSIKSTYGLRFHLSVIFDSNPFNHSNQFMDVYGWLTWNFFDEVATIYVCFTRWHFLAFLFEFVLFVTMTISINLEMWVKMMTWRVRCDDDWSNVKTISWIVSFEMIIKGTMND